MKAPVFNFFSSQMQNYFDLHLPRPSTNQTRNAKRLTSTMKTLNGPLSTIGECDIYGFSRFLPVSVESLVSGQNFPPWLDDYTNKSLKPVRIQTRES